MLEANMSLANGMGGNSFNFREFRSLGSLPEEAWRKIDDRVLAVAKSELVGIKDLMSRGDLVRTIDGMGMSVLTINRISEVGEASMAATPDNRGMSGALNYDTINLPMAVTYKDFIVNTRQVSSSNRAGTGLQMDLIDESVRAVTRKLEHTLFAGDFVMAGTTIKGYVPFAQGLTEAIVLDDSGTVIPLPARNAGTGKSWHRLVPTPAADVPWSSATNDAQDIFKDVNTMVHQSMMQNHYGPWVLYVPAEYDTRLNEDYFVSGTGGAYSPSASIRSRLKMINGLQEVTMSRDLPVNTVALVEMTSSNIELINGMSLSVGDWEAPGSKNWEHLFKAVTITVPFLKADQKNQSGIVIGEFKSS